MIGRQSVKVLVINYDGERESYVACCNSIKSDILISRDFVPSNISLIAKWVTVVVRGENACDHIIITDDLFETRVINGVVEVKAEATRVPGETRMYHQTPNASSFFGFISDVDGLISNVDPKPTYFLWVRPCKTANARWKISGEQEVVVSAEFQGGVQQTIEGIIYSESSNDEYIAWSKSKPENDILVDYRKCPGRNSMLGSSVKMMIDEKNQVVDNVTQIANLYQTRTREDDVEIHIDFECISKEGETVFYNSYFGYISDPKQTFRSTPKVGSRYNAWIERNRTPNTNERWRLSDDPVICEQRPAHMTDENGREHSRRYSNGDIGYAKSNPASSFGKGDYSSSSYSARRLTQNSDFRRRTYSPPKSRSRTPSWYGSSDADTIDSDEEFYGFAPCVKHEPIDDGREEITSSSSRQENRHDNSFSSRTKFSKPAHAHSSSQAIDKIDNRDKRPKKERTSEELEKLKLQWELFNMERSISILSKDQKVAELCRKADGESYDTLMSLMRTKD